MYRVIRGSIEPSGMDSARLEDSYRTYLANKYEPFDVKPWYGTRASVTRTGWKVSLDTDIGTYSWIVESTDTIGTDVTLWGDFGIDCPDVRYRTDLYRDKSKKIDKFADLDDAVQYIVNAYADVIEF